MNRSSTLLAVLAALVSCKAKSSALDESQVATTETTANAEVGSTGRAAAALDEGKMGKVERAHHATNGDAPPPPPAAAPVTVATQNGPADKFGDGFAKDSKADEQEHAKAGEKAPEAVTRAWFPETFLFDPLVVTDATGVATVPVRVPDRLTTWHVLALGHSRTGAQGGATTSFLGTLPTYVDPIIPKQLVIGDQIRLPIQIVNTTTAAVTSPLTIEVRGATVTGGAGTHTVPAQGSIVVYATLTTAHAGTADGRGSPPAGSAAERRGGSIEVRVAFGSTDAVLRTIEVVPSGRPIVTTRSGTLAAPRTLTIAGPAGSDPTTDRVRLLAFPGALALLRAELGTSTSRTGVADDAYALLLAGKASALLAALGDKPDPEALRSLSILTSQRAIRDGRTLDVATAALLTEAALAHPENPVVMRLGERAADYLATNQRPDGTFGGGSGWTLQRVLVMTADATRAVASSAPAATSPVDTSITDRQRALGVRARASGAFERNLDRVEDGYTAAAILASGAATGATLDRLRAKVRDAIKPADDGSKYLDVPAGVVRADGQVPSRAEATALAVLALTGDPKAPLADLGATLLGTYTLDRGWGDGYANLVAMRAVVELFKDPVPANVKITLTMDGKPVVDGVLGADKLREVLALETPIAGTAGDHVWAVTADPPVAGLGYSLSLESWVPWDKEATNAGLELALPANVTGTVGEAIPIAVTAIAPSGRELHLQEALPAGVQVDRPSLDALVSASIIESYEVADGKLDLHIGALAPGKTFAATYKVIPTLAGSLHTSASLIEADQDAFHVPPTTWTIK